MSEIVFALQQNSIKKSNTNKEEENAETCKKRKKTLKHLTMTLLLQIF